jgi:hypothetical protein
MNVRALVCCRCGGPLANPEVLPALVDCVYCGTAHSVSDDAAAEWHEVAPWDVRKKALASFTDALVAALNQGQAPFDALRASSAAHLGIAGSADTVARIALALAQDFEQEAMVSIVRDPVVLSRIAQSYLLALDELRTSESYDFSLPFLAVNERGPAHLQRMLTAKILLELARREPRLDSPLPTPTPSELAPVATEKKKGWWPF